MTAYVVVSVVTFTLVYLIKFTDGPFDIFLRFRKLIGLVLAVYDDDYREVAQQELLWYMEDGNPESFLAKLVHCFWCLATWVSFVVTLAYILMMNEAFIEFPFIWLFSVGISGILYELIYGKN